MLDPAAPSSTDPLPSQPVGLPPNVAACLACVFPLIGGLILLNVERKHTFVRFYAMQSIYFGGASVVIYIVFWIAGSIVTKVPLLGGLLGWIVSLLWVIVALLWLTVYLLTIINSIAGKTWTIPFLGALAREQLVEKAP